MAFGTAVRAPRPPGSHRRSNPTQAVRHDRAGFRPDIEGLRALAILPVLAYHAALFLEPGGGGPLVLVTGLANRVTGGFLGVDVFFVISGYLITGLLVNEAGATGRIHFGRFYARRARRILPAATATLLVTLAVSMLVLPAVRLATTADDVLWATIFNADVHFGASNVDYMGVASAPSPVLHFWSLNDEEKFYVVWPAVLAVLTWGAVRLGGGQSGAGQAARPSLRPIAFVGMLAIAAPSLLWSQHQVSVGAVSGYYAAPGRAFELAAGGLLAIALPLVERTARPVRVVGALVGFVVVVGCMLTYDSATPFPGVHALPVVLGTVLIIAGHPAGVVSRGLSRPPVRWVGRISYSLYLWHWPVLVLAAAAAGGRLTATEDLACVALAVGLAWASYVLIEQPPQRSTLMRSTRTALVFGLVAILVTVAAAIGVRRHAEQTVAAADARAAAGIAHITTKDNHLLLIGDSITTRGEGPLNAALKAAGWDFTIDALGGRPIVSGARATWTPHCVPEDLCGGDRVLAARPIPATLVVALGSNAVEIRRRRVAPPSATDSGLRDVRDSRGRLVVKGQDSPAQVAAEVTAIMKMVPRTTTVYWVGIWLDDARWGNVTWRASNRAMQAAAARYPNARFLDWAAYVQTHQVPYTPDGSHPDRDGMVLRARWLVSQLR